MANETQTPWEHIHMFDGEEIIRGNLNQDEPTIIAVLKSQVDAERIVTCVNACEGQDIETVKLATAHRDACFTWETEMMKAIGEDGVGSVVAAINILKLQRDELLVVLEYAKARLNNWGKRVGEDPDTAIIDKAINNAKPKTDENTN